MTTSVGFAEISTHVLIEQIKADIKEQYFEDDTPWIVGFSGGKDSTSLLQLTFYSLLELQRENIKIHKEINEHRRKLTTRRNLPRTNRSY